MTKSTLLAIAVVTALAPTIAGCASDARIESTALTKSRPIAAPAEFVNMPDAAPLPKVAKSERRVDTSIQQASGELPDEELGNHRTRTAIARLTERSGQVEQAEKMYQAILDKEPNNPMPYHRLAVIAAQKKQWSQAERLFRKVYTMARPSSELLSDMGYFYYLRHQLDEARQLSERALQLDPENRTAHNNLGLVYGEQGMFAESLAAFQRAVPTAEAHANLAYVLAQAGQTDQAIEHYSKSLTLNDGLRASARAMVQLAEQRAVQPAERPVVEAAPGREAEEAAGVRLASAAPHPAPRPMEPEYDAVTIADATQREPIDLEHDRVVESREAFVAPRAEVPDVLSLPQSAPADRIYPSVAERAPSARVRPAETIDLAEELASYLEQSAVAEGNRPPQPSAEVRSAVAQAPAPPQDRREISAAAPAPRAVPAVPACEPVAAVPAGPTAEEIAAEQARLVRQQASREYRPKNNLLDIDRVAAGSGTYRPRSVVGTLRPTRSLPPPAAQTTTRQVSHQEPVASQVAKASVAKPDAKPLAPANPLADQRRATLDIDRLPEPSRWDRSQQGAPAVSPEVSSHIVPRPLKVEPAREAKPVPQAAGAPSIVRHMASMEHPTTLRFVGGRATTKPATSAGDASGGASTILRASYDQSSSPTQVPPRNTPANGSTLRFLLLPAGE